MYLMKRSVSFKKLTALISRCFKRAPRNQTKPIDMTAEEDLIMLNDTDGLVPYDENLLEHARTQWQFGDWESLIKIERETLQHHPDRAKLALLAASGHLQQGDNNTARQFTRLAQDWGCSKKLLSQILIAGVHNSLGRASAINGDGQRALQHFESAIAAGSPAGEVRLLTKARLGEQLGQLGLTEDKLNICLSNGNVRLRKDATQATRIIPDENR
jgi:Flp pilus assembly protein TadD